MGKDEKGANFGNNGSEEICIGCRGREFEDLRAVLYPLRLDLDGTLYVLFDEPQ